MKGYRGVGEQRGGMSFAKLCGTFSVAGDAREEIVERVRRAVRVKVYADEVAGAGLEMALGGR